MLSIRGEHIQYTYKTMRKCSETHTSEKISMGIYIDFCGVIQKMQICKLVQKRWNEQKTGRVGGERGERSKNAFTLFKFQIVFFFPSFPRKFSFICQIGHCGAHPHWDSEDMFWIIGNLLLCIASVKVYMGFWIWIPTEWNFLELRHPLWFIMTEIEYI